MKHSLRSLVVVPALTVLLFAPGASALRAAVIIGNNEGARGEGTLQYAQNDAERMADALHSVGGFSTNDVRVLRSPRADDVRAALLQQNEAFRSRLPAEMSAEDSMLVVYYSGHADAEALHLGDERLALRELLSFVKSSPARVRLLIVDACRSGALVNRKGGAPAPALFSGTMSEALVNGEGMAVLTAASAGEDAQESSQIAGSFFTHHFVSGMLGAADDNGDGLIGLGEAFRYAREGTVRDSSASIVGTQHPSYRYDLSGSDDILLSTPDARAMLGGLLAPAAYDVLLFSGGEGGRLVAEARSSSSSRILHVRRGRYFVRVRAPHVLFEGDIDVANATTTVLDFDALERIEYARLVRKGVGPSSTVAALAAVGGHTPLTGEAPCLGANGGALIALGSVVVVPRVGTCVETFTNESTNATTVEVAASLGLRYAWNLPWELSVSVGPEAGVAYLHQSFTSNSASPTAASPTPDNNLVGPFFGVVALLEWQGPWGMAPFVDLGARTYLLPVEQEGGQSALAGLSGLTAGVGLAKYF